MRAIGEGNVTQEAEAALLGVEQEDFSSILRMRFCNVSESTLEEVVNTLEGA
jgi:hypothetical protein